MRTLFAVVVTVAGGAALAEPPDDTLRHYLGKSQYALLGEVLSEPARVERAPDDARGLIRKGQVVYTCRVRVAELLQGPDGLQPGREIAVCVARWPDEKDELPAALRKGEKCVFFLDWVYSAVGGGSTAWVTTDPWFGVQRYNAKMVELLRAQGRRKERAN